MAAGKNNPWEDEKTATKYLARVKDAIPLAPEQMDVALRVIRAAKPSPAIGLDLGCGDGRLGKAVMEAFPGMKFAFVDFSEKMIGAAKRNLAGSGEHAAFFVSDLATPGWAQTVRDLAPFDIIVSGFAIHHLPDERKKLIYREILDLLSPGGVFLNFEHVSSATPWVEERFDEFMIDSIYERNMQKGDSATREEIRRRYEARTDKEVNILAPVRVQNDWLREIGFVEVDCFFRVFEIALFGGMRPED